MVYFADDRLRSQEKDLVKFRNPSTRRGDTNGSAAEHAWVKLKRRMTEARTPMGNAARRW